MALTSTIREILNNLSTRAREREFLFGDYLSDLDDQLKAGNLGIQAEAGAVDSVALGGGHFERDKDVASGSSLVFAWKTARFWNGLALVTVPAGTLNLAPSTTNYIQVDPDGGVSANTSGFAADGSKFPLWRVTTGTSSYTDAQVVNQKPLVQWLPKGRITGALLSDPAKTKLLEISLGTVTASLSERIIAPPWAGKLVSAHVMIDGSIAANDASYWAFGLIKVGAGGGGGTAMLETGSVNTTKVTGGAALTADVARSLVLHATAANLSHLAAEGLVFSATKTGTPANLSGAKLMLGFAIEG